MGQRLIALAGEDAALRLVAAVERAGHPLVGGSVGGLGGGRAITVTTEIPRELDVPEQSSRVVIVDFTTPLSMRGWLNVARARRYAVVVGTTGLQPGDHAAIDEAAREIPVLQAPNMSLGVNLLFKIAGEVAKILGDDYDIEIVEGHHRFKKDAPSGTAMGLAEAILKATGKGADALIYDRHGDDCVRKPGEIGMHALRMGDEVGRHTAYFAALGERLELTHVATNRDTFAAGALRAARWLATQKPGRYAMVDVLGLT